MIKKLQTITLSLLFLLLFLAISFADQWLLGQSTAEAKVYIESSPDESAESFMRAHELSINQALLDEIIATHQRGEHIAKQDQFINLDTQRQRVYLKELIKSFNTEKDNQAIINTLSSLKIEQRIMWQQQFQYAKALSDAGEKSQALTEYQVLLNEQPNHQAAAINHALLLNKTKRFDEALASAKHAIKITSGSKRAKALSIKGRALRELGELTRAEIAYQKSLEYRPDHASTWLKLAIVQQKLQRPFHAVRTSFERSLSLKPHSKLANQKYGNFLLASIHPHAAIVYLEHALANAGNDENVIKALAWAYLEADRYADSAKLWQRLVVESSTKHERLFASHVVTAINQQPNQLKPLIINTDETRYWLAWQSLMSGKGKHHLSDNSEININSASTNNLSANEVRVNNAITLLQAIPDSSRWYWRGQLLLNTAQPSNTSRILSEPRIYSGQVLLSLSERERTANRHTKALAYSTKVATMPTLGDEPLDWQRKVAIQQLLLLESNGLHRKATQYFAALSPDITLHRSLKTIGKRLKEITQDNSDNKDLIAMLTSTLRRFSTAIDNP